jgi:hypothetical protein
MKKALFHEPNLRSNNVHLSLRQALRLRDLANTADDKDLCKVADRIISPKTCTLCGDVNEGVSRDRNIGGYICRACFSKGRDVSSELQDRM